MSTSTEHTPDTAAVADGPRATEHDVVEPAGDRGGLLGRPAVGRGVGVTLLAAGIIGFVASATLTVERFNLLIDPSYRPSCSINPILSCGSVMTQPQAAIFGFPNPLIGIASFAVIIVTGVLATARVDLPRWYWLGQTLCTAAGFVMVNWLAFQSLYRINALCPYCMVVWVVTPIVLILSAGRLFNDASPRAQEIRGWLWVLLPVWYAIVIVAIGVQFWDYWSTLI
ncbi:vitamin K epoxide reductase family protein [Gordonia sinesedis]